MAFSEQLKQKYIIEFCKLLDQNRLDICCYYTGVISHIKLIHDSDVTIDLWLTDEWKVTDVDVDVSCKRKDFLVKIKYGAFMKSDALLFQYCNYNIGDCPQVRIRKI